MCDEDYIEERHYNEDDDTHDYPVCPYDEHICVLQLYGGCEKCDVRRCYED